MYRSMRLAQQGRPQRGRRKVPKGETEGAPNLKPKGKIQEGGREFEEKKDGCFCGGP